MRIKINMPRCIGGMAVMALWFITAVSPVRADVCFLPTGICEQGVTTKNDTAQCTLNLSIYKSAPVEGKKCTKVEVPGCPTVYECFDDSCDARGYKIKGTTSSTAYPNNYNANLWTCNSCLQGKTYFWNCTPKPCPRGTTKAKASCAAGYEWQAQNDYGMSGNDRCGTCVMSSCPSGTTSTPASGCQICEVSSKLANGTKCYKCHSMSSDYNTQTQIDATYRRNLAGSCYHFNSKQAADSTVCYSVTESECGTDQYKGKATVNGQKACQCVDYAYTFVTIDGKEEVNLNFPATGGTSSVGVSSSRSATYYGGGISEGIYFSSRNTEGSGLSVSTSGNVTTISAPKNEDQTTDKTYTVQLIQQYSNKVITIHVKVAHDACPNDYKFDDKCEQTGWRTKTDNRTSTTGKACYKCYNDNCPEGYTKGTTPTNGNYDTDTTSYGSNCYKARPDDCPSGYTKGTTPLPTNHYTTSTTPFGSNCYQQKEDDCTYGSVNPGYCPYGRSYVGKSTLDNDCY
ncbi:MAG: hypothetical protein IJS88_07415, partial [Alphaproteobacteria bacterium]|nr:hypothetical protein [Alphaproteobacteria bacterium]